MHKILIANRGEIAVRIMHTARRMGLRTVAVYSDADAAALHVSSADEAVHIGASSASDSYLRIDRVLSAAKQTDSDALHPGYGFLAENAELARACDAAGVLFIGPSADAIELMGSKRRAKQAMLAAGVPCIPGYHGAVQSDAELVAQAAAIGYPLMVKASAGGGGRGLRHVVAPAELAEALSAARSEARHAFGSDELILERAVADARHIEVQVFADRDGNTVHLGERDCSLQRRHQKVLEEAPSPFVDGHLRQRMGETALAAARACHYVGAGTVEFLVDAQRNFWFLEMNTRLQVEHAVTEMVTGFDLVEWQLRVARGEPLPAAQSAIHLRGHAIEARLYAEDPRHEFLPQAGRIHRLRLPAHAATRVDAGVREGQVVSTHYDPLLAKLIAHGDDRESARQRLEALLRDTELVGVATNKQFLARLLGHPRFAAGDVTTTFLAQHFADDASLRPAPPSRITIAGAAILCYRRRTARHRGTPANAWSSAVPVQSLLQLSCDGREHDVAISGVGEDYALRIDDTPCALLFEPQDAGRCIVIDDRCRQALVYAFDDDGLYIDDGHGHHAFVETTWRPFAMAESPGDGLLYAAMDGAIVALPVAEGDPVTAGTTLVVLEAMKMEHRLKAGIAGVVESIKVRVGQQVRARELVATIVAEESAT